MKMFQVEPRVPVRFLIDVSASMTVGHKAGPESALSSITPANWRRRWCTSGLVRLDSILLQPFSARLFDPFMASGGRHRFQPAETYLRALEAHGKTNYFETARQFLSAYPQRGLTILLSDFLDDGDCFHPLQYLADFGHELLLIQLWGEEDRTPSGKGEVELIDAESGTHVKIALDEEARECYTRAFDEHAAELRKLALRNGGRYAGLSTAMSIEDAMFGPLMMVQGV